jgi:hypothetical protein
MPVLDPLEPEEVPEVSVLSGVPPVVDPDVPPVLVEPSLVTTGAV